jgi:hypothetical protein
MAVALPNGTLFAIASGYGAAKTMSALSNANPGVATLEASHGVATGEMIEVTSGWSKLNGRIVKAGTVATNDVPLSGINTTSTTLYPAGTGTGTVREITGWTQIQQVLSVESNGGEQQFLEYQFVEDDDQKRVPTSKSASGLTMSVADDPSLAWNAIVSAANDDKLPRAIRATLPSGATIFYNAYVTVNDTPSMNVNNIMAVQVTLSLLARPVRYAA